MTDVCKAFGCLHRQLLKTKFDAYGFDLKSMSQNHCISNLKQIFKVGKVHGSSKQIFKVFLRIQFLVQLFSTSSCVTCFVSWMRSQ